MINIYIFLFLATIIVPNKTYVEPTNDNARINKTEQEKDINNENLYTKINRDIDFYSYYISIGHSSPINKNISEGVAYFEISSISFLTCSYECQSSI